LTLRGIRRYTAFRMLSRELLRADAERVRRAFAERGHDPGPFDRWHELDLERRRKLVGVEELKHARNEASQKIAKLKAEGGDAAAEIARVTSSKARVAELEAEVAELEGALAEIELALPNLPHASVPRGPDAGANRVERVVGEPRRFEFAPKPHWELGAELGILDFERGAKLAGARPRSSARSPSSCSTSTSSSTATPRSCRPTSSTARA
jgi:seryl-tRNA synthetase